MHNLEKAIAEAEKTANREGKPVAIYNLNSFSPLYVIRSAPSEGETPRGYVQTVEPDAKPIIIEICPNEPRASACLANGESIVGSDYESDMLDCVAQGDCEDACEFVRDQIRVEFRIVARDENGSFENRLATSREMAATCRAIYFDSETDFDDIENAALYLIWEAASGVQSEIEETA